MIHKIPQSWDYNDSLEMLFLFYQRADELLSENTPDSYALPLHNAVSLVCEMSEVLALLKKYGSVNNYYMQYIPPIIEEFIVLLEKDYILKRMLGRRLDSIKTGFIEAEKTSAHLETWINVFAQTCSVGKYREAYKAEICRLITSTTDKEKLLYCTANYFTYLMWIGYTREHLYISTKKYFNSNSIRISSSNQICAFLDSFTDTEKEFSFLVLMDVESLEYFDRISDNSLFGKNLHILDISKERKDLEKDFKAAELFRDLDKLNHNSGPHTKLAIVRYIDEALDPYISAIRFRDYTQFVQTYARYYKHFNSSKQVYKFLVETETKNHFVELKLPNKLYKRPYIDQDTIDSRIKNILSYSDKAYSAFWAITKAIDMHADTLDSRDTTTILKGFWTALETLFSNPVSDAGRENVIKSMIPIIQKTYLLKSLRNLYHLLKEAVSDKELLKLEISDFPSFVEYFSSFDENSAEMKKIYALLAQNPLLRTRLFSVRKKLKTGKKIDECLSTHRDKIEWQVKRIYRMRNISTHLGTRVTGVDVAVNHLHNYFDYMVNYMLCKLENGDYIQNTSSVVFEAKNDTRIHHELLKDNKPLSRDNYLEYLFGPDQNLIYYQFE